MHVVVVSGMLGVGKTSVILDLLRDLMESGRKVAVIENDFGSIGIDGDVINRDGVEVRELKGGCVCCTLKTGMVETLRYLQSNVQPEVVLIEPTGIADPSYILNTVDDVSGLNISDKTAIIVVDAERFKDMKRMFERPLKNQLNVANVVLINKIDTQSEEALGKIEGGIRELGYSGTILRVQAESGENMRKVSELIF